MKNRMYSAMWLGIFFFLLYHSLNNVVNGQSYATLPSYSECMYFTDQNGIAEVLKRDVVDVNGTATIQANVVQILQNVGYLPSSMVFYYNTLYIASSRAITTFDVSDNLKRGRVFADLAFSQNFTCEPGGMIVHDDALWVACYIGDPHAIIKFSLLPQDYGAFLAGSTAGVYGSYLYGVSGFFVATGVFEAYPVDYYYTYAGPITFNGTFGIINDFYGYQYKLLQLNNRTTSVNASDVYILRGWAVIDVANATYTNWQGTAFGPDGNLYVARSYYLGGTNYYVGDIAVYEGRNISNWLRTIVPYSASLANVIGLAFGPDGNLYVSVGNLVGVSSILVYNTSGAKLSTFFEGTRQNDIIPQYLYWYTCPFSPTPGDSVDTTTVVLATVIPVLALFLSCLICCLIALLLFLVVSRILANRRRIYSVRDDDDRVEMGRGGKTHFSYREIDPDELEIGDLLGEGAFGKVYRGTYRGAPVAIKTFDQIKLDEADEQTLAEIREEAQMMERLGNHPNVINFVGAITSAGTKGHQLHFSLVTEYCPNGSLFDFLIKKKTRLPLIMLVKMARDIAAGILHLHREKVIHRDIASRNILVGNNYAVYISDFGMARIKQQDVNTTIANVGPVKWMAPECMTHKQYSEASDAFAYGVLLWEMITRQIPWKGMDPTQVIIAVTRKNTRLEVPADADPVLKKIIKAVWRENPEKRMTMAAIVSKLDTYLHTLEEMYDNISSDEEDTGTRSEKEYFKVDSDESGRSLRRTPKPIRRGGDSKVDMSEQSAQDLRVDDDYSSMDEKPSAEPYKKKKEKEKEREKKAKEKNEKKGKRVTVEADYGEIPGNTNNYGEIPAMGGGKGNYGEIPEHLGQNYGHLPPKHSDLL